MSDRAAFIVMDSSTARWLTRSTSRPLGWQQAEAVGLSLGGAAESAHRFMVFQREFAPARLRRDRVGRLRNPHSSPVGTGSRGTSPGHCCDIFPRAARLPTGHAGQRRLRLGLDPLHRSWRASRRSGAQASRQRDYGPNHERSPPSGAQPEGAGRSGVDVPGHRAGLGSDPAERPSAEGAWPSTLRLVLAREYPAHQSSRLRLNRRIPQSSS